MHQHALNNSIAIELLDSKNHSSDKVHFYFLKFQKPYTTITQIQLLGFADSFALITHNKKEQAKFKSYIKDAFFHFEHKSANLNKLLRVSSDDLYHHLI